jgi:hypothetical protein
MFHCLLLQNYSKLKKMTLNHTNTEKVCIHQLLNIKLEIIKTCI